MSARTAGRAAAILIALAFLLAACSGTGTDTKKEEYMHITQAEAKSIMDSETGYVILDVRTEEEFAAGHIPNAILIPDYEIAARAETELTDKGQLILVYCRSGRRSKAAASELASLGYSNVKEFGGIIDWEYETAAD